MEYTKLNITADSVASAMKYIDENGIPERRDARSITVCNPNSNADYPVKYVCELAHNSISSNDSIGPDNFISHTAAKALKDLGFEVRGYNK